MKKLLVTTIVLIVLFVSSVYGGYINNNVVYTPPVKDTTDISIAKVSINNDTIFCDSLTLSLKNIPRAQHLFTVAKLSVGRWAKLFTVLKIEESGADGQNSWYATNYYNLTGMRCVGAGRKTTSNGCGHNQYAKFNNWHDCVLDFKHYIDVMDARFVAKYKRAPKDEFEMVDFMHGSFNVYGKWKADVYWLLRHFQYK